MWKFTLKIDGMRCGTCETHVNDVLRKTARVKKATSSHAKGEAVVIAEEELDEEAISQAIAAQGYRVLSVSKEPYEKKGLFSFLKR